MNVQSHILTFNLCATALTARTPISFIEFLALFETANILRSWLSGCSQLFGDLYDWFVFSVIFSARWKCGAGTHKTQAGIHRITQRFGASARIFC